MWPHIDYGIIGQVYDQIRKFHILSVLFRGRDGGGRAAVLRSTALTLATSSLESKGLMI